MSVRPATWKLWTALLTVYLVWGSTYLAIKISVRSLPALLSAGARFLVAGLLLGAVVTVSGRSLRVSAQQLAASAGLGVALLACGVGVVTLSETRIDSSVAAMIAGSVPLQVVVMRLLARERVAVATRVAAAAGLGGLALIVVPGGSSGRESAVGLALMLGASISWSTGSFLSSRLPLPRDPFVATTYEMLGGGVALAAIALATGEGVRGVHPSGAALAAWAYLVVAGSLVGFTAYAWLLRHAPISQAVTHQYVNPIVALALGTLLLDERLTASALAGAAVVIGAVFVTVRREAGRPEADEALAAERAPA
jgi:drug/metabolite transporter (DMT)-like permease